MIDFEALPKAILAGEITDIKELLSRYAARDLEIESLDTEFTIPQELFDEVQGAQDYLDELQNLSDEEVAQRTAEWNAEVTKHLESQPSAEEIAKQDAACSKLLAGLANLDFTSFEDELKELVDRAGMFLHGVQYSVRGDTLSLFEKTLTEDEWKKMAMSNAAEALQQGIRNLERVSETIAENNEYRLKLKELIDANF